MNFTNTHYSGTPYQNGAALIVSLMMLVVMTILAVSAVTTTTMQEKMAGNIRNKHMSFQATEAALRAGETKADTLTDATNFNGTLGLYDRSDPGDTNYPIWEYASATWQTITTSTGTIQSPEYIIEDFGDAPRDSDCLLDAELPTGCLLPVYRVSAQGFGLNTNAQTILQSTYKKL